MMIAAILPRPPRRYIESCNDACVSRFSSSRISGLAAALVSCNAKEPISQPDHRLAPVSSLVTVSPLTPLFAHISGCARATPALGPRAARRGSNRGSPVCAASVVGWPSCSPPGTWSSEQYSAGERGRGWRETASGSTGIDVACSCSSSRVLLGSHHAEGSPLPTDTGSDVLIPIAVTVMTMPARHRQHHSSTPPKLFTITLESLFTFALESAFTLRWKPRSHEPEYALDVLVSGERSRPHHRTVHDGPAGRKHRRRPDFRLDTRAPARLETQQLALGADTRGAARPSSAAS